MSDDRERFINDQMDQRAELYLLRLILQILLSRLLEMTGQRAEATASIEQQVKTVLSGPIPSDGNIAQNAEQMRRMMMAHAESFFRQIHELHQKTAGDLD